MSQNSESPIVVTDKRRFNLDEGEIVPAPPLIQDPFMYVGQFYEINGLCYRVRKVTPHDIVLRRFTGTLAVDRVNATALQIKGARPA